MVVVLQANGGPRCKVWGRSLGSRTVEDDGGSVDEWWYPNSCIWQRRLRRGKEAATLVVRRKLDDDVGLRRESTPQGRNFLCIGWDDACYCYSCIMNPITSSTFPLLFFCTVNSTPPLMMFVQRRLCNFLNFDNLTPKDFSTNNHTCHLFKLIFCY